MKSLTAFCILTGCIAPAFLSGCAIDIAGSALPPPSNQPPTCHLEAQPAEIFEGQSTTITCSVSERDGDAITYVWHSQTGCMVEGDGATVQASPSHSGFFYIEVTVSDKDGEFTAGVTIAVAKRNPPSIFWTRDIPAQLGASDIIMTREGGYATVGRRETYEPYAAYHSIVAVTDADIEPLWTAEGPPRTAFSALAQTNDGGLIVAGTSGDCLAVWDKDIYISRYAKSGAFENQRHYGGDHWDEAYGILPVGDSTFVVLASGAIFGGMGLLWITESGDTLRSCPVAGGTYVHDFARMPNGDIVVAGVQSNSYGDPIVLDLTRVSAEGVVIWAKQYEGFAEAPQVAVCPSSDGGVAIAVGLDLLHTDASGRLLWRRSCFHGHGYGYPLFYDVLADEQGYLLVGHDDGTFVDRDGAFVVRTNLEGNLVWYHFDNDLGAARKVLPQAGQSPIIYLDGGVLVSRLIKFAAE